MLHENADEKIIGSTVKKQKPLDNRYVILVRRYDEKQYILYLMSPPSSDGGCIILGGNYKSAVRLVKKSIDKIVQELNENPYRQDRIKMPYAKAVLYREILEKHAVEESRLTEIQEGSLTSLKHYVKLTRSRLNLCSRASASTVKWLLKHELAVFDSEDIHLSITKKGISVLKSGKLS